MRLRNYWHLIVLFSAWLFVSLPLFGNRFIPTHDGEYHLIRISEFSKMLAAGNIIPRWAPDLNSGYGFPLFIFHYPFPNYVGSLVHFVGFSLVQSFQISLALGMLILSLGTLFFLSKEFEDKKTALIGALVLLTIPYLFVDVYIRGSIGEIWALAWGSVALASLVWERKLLLACSIGLLIISHNIMAMILIPILLLYACFFYRKFLGYILAGVLFSTYFWLPALGERQYVIGLNSVSYGDHFPTLVQLLFPSWGSNFSQPGMATNEMSQQIGIIPLIIIVITTIIIINIIKNSKKSPQFQKVLFFFFITIISLILLFSIADPIWKLVSLLQYVQYPWRLLSMLLITIPFLTAALIHRARPIVGWGIVVLAWILVFPYLQPVTYEPRDDSYYLSRKEFTDGTSSMGNSFSTIWSAWQPVRPMNRIEVLGQSGKITSIHSTPTSDNFVVQLDADATIKVNRLYYPGWYARVDGKPTQIEYQTNGILSLSLAKGEHTVVIAFGSTPLRTLANTISLVSLVIIIVHVIRQRYAHRI